MKLTALAALAFVFLGACACIVADVALNESAVRTDRGECDLTGAQGFSVVAEFGSVKAVATAGGPEVDASTRVRWEAVITARGRTVEEARAALDRYRVEVREGADGVVRLALVGEPLTVDDAHGRRTLSAWASFDVAAPQGVRLTAQSGAGPVTVSGPFGEVRARSSFGAVRVTGARGDVDARAESGAVDLEDVRGGAASAASGFGRVAVAGGAAALVARSDSGAVSIRDWAGDVEARSGFGHVDVERGRGAVLARSESGRVSVSEWTGDVAARSGFGEVRIDGVLTDVDARSESGSVTVTARPGSAVRDDWNAETGFGSVTFVAATALNGDVAARTGFGRIDCEGIATAIERSADGKRLAARLGEGGRRISLRSDSGSVHLRGAVR
ncbi:MAG TPA: hypothetical protein VEI02_10350 [Planctomycetota bacterium]|nr:hypothetical protein [Planctomycetota bacterium]